MNWINRALAGLFDVFLYPFRDLHPAIGLSVASLLTGLGMLLVFKHSSDQPRISTVKRHVHACFFEMRLFNDDMRAVLRAQCDLLRHNLTYLRLSLVPIGWMILPLALVVAQLHPHYAYGGLSPHEKALVKIVYKDGWVGSAAGGPGGEPGKPVIELTAPPGLRVETSPVWVPDQRELTWRIVAERPGDYQIKVRAGEGAYTKRVRVSESVVRRSPVRAGPGLLMQLLNPAEAPIPKGSPLESIRVSYPESHIEVLGFRLHWMVVFFLGSTLSALLLRNRVGVTL